MSFRIPYPFFVAVLYSVVVYTPYTYLDHEFVYRGFPNWYFLIVLAIVASWLEIRKALDLRKTERSEIRLSLLLWIIELIIYVNCYEFQTRTFEIILLAGYTDVIVTWKALLEFTQHGQFAYQGKSGIGVIPKTWYMILLFLVFFVFGFFDYEMGTWFYYQVFPSSYVVMEFTGLHFWTLLVSGGFYLEVLKTLGGESGEKEFHLSFLALGVCALLVTFLPEYFVNPLFGMVILLVIADIETAITNVISLARGGNISDNQFFSVTRKIFRVFWFLPMLVFALVLTLIFELNGWTEMTWDLYWIWLTGEELVIYVAIIAWIFELNKSFSMDRSIYIDLLLSLLLAIGIPLLAFFFPIMQSSNVLIIWILSLTEVFISISNIFGWLQRSKVTS